MAEVTHVQLDLPQPASGDDTATVTVSYAIEFEPDEVGEPYHVRIELWGKDEPAPGSLPPAVMPAPLYTFQFPVARFSFLRRPWLTITAEPVVKDTVTRSVPRARLDEDAARTVTGPYGEKHLFQDPDEVYARVTVSREHSATSNVVTVKA